MGTTLVIDADPKTTKRVKNDSIKKILEALGRLLKKNNGCVDV